MVNGAQGATLAAEQGGRLDATAGSPDADDADTEDPPLLAELLEGGPELPAPQLRDKLRRAFKELDTDGSGSIGTGELLSALNRCGIHATKEASETVLKTIDSDGSGEIDCDEFIQFFIMVNDLDDQAHGEEDDRHRGEAANVVVCGFLVVNIVALVYVGFRLLSGSSNAVLEVAFITFSSTLGLMVCWMLLIPLCYMKLRPVYDNAHRRAQARARLRGEERKAKTESLQAAVAGVGGDQRKHAWGYEPTQQAQGYRTTGREVTLRAAALADEEPCAALAPKIAWQDGGTPSGSQSITGLCPYLASSYDEAAQRQQRVLGARRAPYTSFSSMTSASHPHQTNDIMGAGAVGPLAITDA